MQPKDHQIHYNLPFNSFTVTFAKPQQIRRTICLEFRHPSSFVTKGATYAKTGKKTVWTRTTGSGNEKRQCTVQLTVFADGEPRVKPLLIFKGTGKRISDKKTKQYDSRVVVKFQENARCDENIMMFWLRYGTCGMPR